LNSEHGPPRRGTEAKRRAADAASRPSRGGRTRRFARLLLVGQGVYYLVTGAWPLVSLRTFELVTGPKTDDWLVQTVGALATVIGASVLVGARRLPPSAETLVLAGGSAAAFAAVDVVYTLRGTISPIYLADAAVEVVLLAGALAGWRTRRRNA
jgi:hypothetical protein